MPNRRGPSDFSQMDFKADNWLRQLISEHFLTVLKGFQLGSIQWEFPEFKQSEKRFGLRESRSVAVSPQHMFLSLSDLICHHVYLIFTSWCYVACFCDHNCPPSIFFVWLQWRAIVLPLDSQSAGLVILYGLACSILHFHYRCSRHNHLTNSWRDYWSDSNYKGGHQHSWGNKSQSWRQGLGQGILRHFSPVAILMIFLSAVAIKTNRPGTQPLRSHWVSSVTGHADVISNQQGRLNLVFEVFVARSIVIHNFTELLPELLLMCGPSA